jgi:outer membrane protein insertion porin family
MLKKLLFIFTLGFTFSLYGQTIESLEVSCLNPKDSCVGYDKQFTFLIGTSRSEVNEKLKLLFTDSMFDYLKYDINAESKLQIVISPKKRVRNIYINSNSELSTEDLAKQLNIKAGDYSNEDKTLTAKEIILKYFNDKGYISKKVDLTKKDYKDQVDLHFFIDVKNNIVLRDIIVETELADVKRALELRFKKYLNQPWDKVSFRLDFDDYANSLVGNGYLYSQTFLEMTNDDEGRGRALLRVKHGPKVQFSFEGNNVLSRGELLSNITQIAENSFGERLTKDEISDSIIRQYEKIGFYGSEVEIREQEGTNRYNEAYFNFYVSITEGVKVRVRGINFNGNMSVTDKEIRDLYEEHASTLASRRLYDNEYLNQFSKILKQHYLQQGFVLVNVSEPKITWIGDKKEIRVDYSIRERQKTMLKAINLKGIDEEIRAIVASKMLNKVGSPLNVVAIQDDLTNSLKIVQNEGYFFARFLNLDNTNVVTYTNSYQDAEINIEFELQSRTHFRDVVVTGNHDTKEYVIVRELRLKQGDLITPDILTEFRDRLIQLGIFSNVKIVPYVNDNNSTTLFVQVTERDFGTLEIAPGFRTDIGAKISAGITYNNLWGANHTAGINIQANQRFDYDELDERRSNAKKKLLEYQAKVNYVVPYIWQNVFVKPLSLDMSASVQRKRFYGFDADITRLSPTLNYSFNKIVSMGVKYQFEAISQFDASNPKDNDNFTIGAITPSITLDFRDDPINPRKGYYFGLSWEFANPYFFSANDDDLTINFSKVIQRNRLYIPMGKNWVLATSLSWGHQENYAKDYKTDANGNVIIGSDGKPVRKGYIPSIKVFRLDGIDTVRGFGDDEINRLMSGPNIGDVTISDQAFFLNFKLEPRYYLSDSMLIGFFFDAGRVYQDSFRPLSLRTSVGAGFKFLTPVGSLDFDYGVKLHRQDNIDTGRESFGRFHLSIGFF